MDDLNALARTGWAEDRSGGGVGMADVMCVVRNRVLIARAFVKEHGHPHPLFGDGTYASACQMPWQFSCWNKNDPNLPKLLDVTEERDPWFAAAMGIAFNVIAGSVTDPTRGATHYKANSLPWPEAWGEPVPPLLNEGGQSYYIIA